MSFSETSEFLGDVLKGVHEELAPQLFGDVDPDCKVIPGGCPPGLDPDPNLRPPVIIEHSQFEFDWSEINDSRV